MRRYLNLAGYSLRFNLLPYILAAIGVFALTPVLFGVTALDKTAAALPLELSLPFIGVVLLTSVYHPEQDKGLLSTVAARKTPYILICIIRIAITLVLAFLLITVFVLLMAFMESDVSAAYALGSYANAVFLGGIGILASALSGNVVIGYMAPVLYYVLDLMGGAVPLTQFSMMREASVEGKGILFVAGIVCVAASMLVRHMSVKRI